jgi:hypothetical protein
MSAQGATLRRGIARMPIWPVAALVTAAVATLIGLSLLDQVRPQGSVTSVTQTERVGISHVSPSLHSGGYAGFENPGAYIQEAPAYAPGLENPGAYIQEAPAYAPGLENPGAYPAEVVAPATGPVVVNGEPCMQCR